MRSNLSGLSLTRRELLIGLLALTPKAHAFSRGEPSLLGFQLTDVTRHAGIDFIHNSGSYGGKFLPETLGAGCAFLDYDNDGWQDILLVNGMDWPGHKKQRTTLQLYRNNRDGTFSNVTRPAGLDVEVYGMGVAVADYNNDGFPDILLTCVGQNRLFRNTGNGTFVDVTKSSGLGGRAAFSTSALWFDYDRDGLLDLFICNYVKWRPEHDVFCSADGIHKAFCTPEAYRGETCWLFRNCGDGTFEDVTASSGIFDVSSKSLGVAVVDFDRDGWPDLIIANDTQPNKLYRNLRNGSFKEVGVETGIAFSSDGIARAGMGVDAAVFDHSGTLGVAITNFDHEMIGFYRAGPDGMFTDVAASSGVGPASKHTVGFGCQFADINLDGAMDLLVANGHIDDIVRDVPGRTSYAQQPHLFLNNGAGVFSDVAALAGSDFAAPKIGRGLACGDPDRDGDIDILMTTNHGPAYLFRNDQLLRNRSIRFHLIGTHSNRDGIGAEVTIFYSGLGQSRFVKSGSSYLSQSELPVTFGLGPNEIVDVVVIQWPSGRTEEYRTLAAGRAYQCTEAKGLSLLYSF